MEIDYSKYSEEELKEAWTSVDDLKFPDRAITIYDLLSTKGFSAHQEDVTENTLLSNVLFMFKPFLGGFLQDMIEENDSCREKEQRVLALIQSSKKNET